MPQMQITNTRFRKIAKSVVFFAIVAAAGFIFAMLLYDFPIGGGGFHVKSPDGHTKLIIMGFDTGLYGSRRVSIMRENEKTKRLEPIFAYLHDVPGLYLRGQTDKKVDWTDDFAKVVITYRDKINSHDVIMVFEYDTKSGDWTLTNKPLNNVDSNRFK